MNTLSPPSAALLIVMLSNHLSHAAPCTEGRWKSLPSSSSFNFQSSTAVRIFIYLHFAAQMTFNFCHALKYLQVTLTITECKDMQRGC